MSGRRGLCWGLVRSANTWPSPSSSNPTEELRDAVHLVVVAPMRKLQNLGLKRIEPRGLFGQQNIPRLDLGRLNRHAGHDVDLCRVEASNCRINFDFGGDNDGQFLLQAFLVCPSSYKLEHSRA